MSNIKRFSIYDPIQKKNVFKSFSTNKYTNEQIEQLAQKWKQDYNAKFQQQKADQQEVAQNETFKVRKNLNLDISTKTGNVICLLGSGRSGKSTLMHYLYEKYFKDCVSILFTPNLHASIYKDYSDKKVAKSSQYHPQIVKKCYKINKNTKNHYNFLFMLDDTVDQKQDKTIMKLFTIYRNSLMNTIICLQDTILLKKTNRANCHYIMFLRFNSRESIEDVIKKYLSGYLTGKNMDEKVEEYKKLTSDHQFILLNNLNDTISIHKLEI